MTCVVCEGANEPMTGQEECRADASRNTNIGVRPWKIMYVVIVRLI